MKTKARGNGEESKAAFLPSSSTFPALHHSNYQGSKAASAAPGIPLLDEVNELLGKEKTLYCLQAAEANATADAWKLKYEKLIGEVADSAVWSGNYQTCEIAAGIEASSCITTGSVEEPESVNFNKMFCLSGSRTINVSNQCLTTSDITHLAKAIREQIHTNPYFVVMRHCNLSDIVFNASHKADAADIFSQLISAPLVEALDFSYNDFGVGFENTLVEALRLKKHSLQYLLLNGNVRMSLCPNISDVLSLLSDKSWGICVTLEDLVEIKDHVKKKAAVGEATDYSGGSHKTMRCAEFLKILNAKLQQVNTNVSATCHTEKKKISKAHEEKYNLGQVTSSRIRPVERRPGGLEAMSVLGLTDACLSRTSIDLLKITLKISVSSLTDLDLSYSFLGLYGAAMIGDSLAIRNSQLIRLGLSGNHLGDTGINLISNSLIKTKTLTHLDIRSNGVTDKGLQSLLQILSLQEVNIPRVNDTGAIQLNNGYCHSLSTVHLSGNFISEDAMSKAEKVIHSTGRDLRLLFVKESLQAICEGIDDPSIYDHEYSYIARIYHVPQLVCYGSWDEVDDERKIYCVDIKYLLPLCKGEAVMSEWYARIGEGSLGANRLFTEMTKTIPRDNKKDAYKIVTNLGERGICFEVRYVGSTGECIEASTHITSSIGLASGEWVQCRSATYGPLPAKGSIEIWAIAKGQVKTRLECRSFTISRVSRSCMSLNEGGSTVCDGHTESTLLLDGHHIVGGDIPYWSVGMNSLISKKVKKELNNSVHVTSLESKTAVVTSAYYSQEHKPLRALVWTESRCYGMLIFHIKLTPVEGVGATIPLNQAFSESTASFNDQLINPHSASSSSMNGNSIKGIGYTFNVHIYCCDGSIRSVAIQNTCTNHLRIDPLDDKNRSNPLVPWIWRPISMYLGEIGPHDKVFICGTPTMNGSVSNSLSSRCFLEIKDCQLLAATKNFLSCEDFDMCRIGSSTMFPSREYQSQVSASPIAFVLHNDKRMTFL